MGDRKKDLVPLVIYHLIITKYMEMKVLQKELEAHLEENYTFKENDISIEDFLCNSIYGDEADAETFVKDVEDCVKRKDDGN